MTLVEQIERLATVTGADTVHLVYVTSLGRWAVICLWDGGEVAQFSPKDTPEEAVGLAVQEVGGDL